MWKSVSVTGFDYSDEWCGLDENNQPHGSKLIIEFTISHNNYGGTQPTNAGASIKDKENKDVITVDNPPSRSRLPSRASPAHLKTKSTTAKASMSLQTSRQQPTHL
ncbi:MAG: hypothetical protein ACLUFI_14270 [Oscillospiraceae bacterium]